MIIDDGTRKVSVVTEEETARYAGTRRLQGSRPAKAEPVGIDAVRAVVEVRRQLGGMSPRALLGGTFEPTTSGDVSVQVVMSDTALGLGEPATCASELGKPLVPGLPEEFASAVLTGLTGGEPDLVLPPGVLTIDRAGYDEVESASRIFELTSELLLRVVAARVAGSDLAETVREAMATWS